MASRSRFYVDTPPCEPKQRHSMIVTHSELVQTQNLSSNSSSATLPSAAGSVDRLTGLDEKKSSRFFTLKPKTSFSLRPFFRSTSSLTSSPGKRRKAAAASERRDSSVQTEESRPEFGEVGVQTLNASTVDVPVQTCLEAWEGGDSYGQRRPTYASARVSPFWCRPSASSSGLSNSLLPKNVPKDPLASPKLVKYAVPGVSEKTALHHQSTDSPVDVNSCQPVSPPSHSVSSASTSVPIKYFSAKELSGNTISLSVSTDQCKPVDKSQVVKPTESNQNSNSVPSNLNVSAKENEKSKCESETSVAKGYTLSDNPTREVSNDLKFPISYSLEHPLSVLKTEGTDSPSRRPKSVHFDLSEPVSAQNSSVDSSNPRNVDKDFEALLRDLNVLTEEDGDLAITLNNVSNEKSIQSNLISPDLKSALDALRQDFLAPIPENLNESNEAESNTVEKSNSSSSIDKDNKTDCKIETTNVNFTPVASKPSLTRKNSYYENQNESELLNVQPALDKSPCVNKDSKTNVKVEVNSDSSLATSKEPLTRHDSEHEYQSAVEINKNVDSVAPTSLSIFTCANSSSNPETNSLEGNVYDNVIKEENSVKTVPLPILPSFFEPPSQAHNLETREIVEYGDSNTTETPSDNQTQSTMPLETESDRNRLSRSSSRSSVKSSSKSGLDSYREPVSRFDSCENLDQLEEEIIRSLYSPDEGKVEDNIMKNIELPPSESFQNSGTTATHMRRVILDQLLNGKNVEDIVPNYPLYQRTHSVPETGSKHKTPAKYTAVLTKMCHDDNENASVNTLENKFDSLTSFGSTNSKTEVDSFKQNISNNASDLKCTSTGNDDSPKRASSVFLFPEDNIANHNTVEKPVLDISTTGKNKGSSILEVRRSSWTPQTTVDSTSSNRDGKKSPEKESTSTDNKTGQCDFTNCLRPSKMQNSPFLAKINTRSMSPCNFSPLPPVYNTSPINNGCSPKRDNSPPKPSEAIGECDFASCLKPSQVQNSLFKAELSEITANKSTNSLRAGSPLTIRTYSPLPIRSSSLDIPSANSISTEKKSNLEAESPEPVKHKSELLITLKTTTKHSGDIDTKSEIPPLTETVTKSDTKSSEISNLDLNANKTSDSNEGRREDSVVPPPPPPPPSSNTPRSLSCTSAVNRSLESLIQDQKSNLTTVEHPTEARSATPKTTVMIELEQRLQDKNDTQRRNSNDRIPDESPSSIAKEGESTDAGRPEIKLNGSPNISNGNQNGSISILSNQREFGSSSPNDKNDRNSYGSTKLTFSPNTVITDEPPPPGAVLLDKKVTVDGDKVHTDKFYAIPVKEVLKEKTSTTKFIPAPPKYEGIGPTEEGIPIGLRNSVKKENMHNWYKTMFKSLHKADSSNDSQEYIIGYTSEPETSKKDMMLRKKSSTLDNRMKHDVNSNFNKQNYPASVKSSIEVYNVRPRLIEDYEPGYSSVTDDTVTTSRRYLPSKNTVKPSYEFKNGYESDSNITKKRDQPESLSTEQQKQWYREIQKGGEIPQFGLGKLAPEKPKEPSIGPIPPPPLNYSGPSCQQAVRPLTLPANYSNQNGNGYCQQMNGAYEMQMRHAIHSEMQQRRSPSSNQLSPPIRTMMKSPSRSPDMKVPAQALFDFKAESPKEIPLKKGDTVLILRQLDKNWYEGEYKGVVGIFPISYVEIIPPEHASTPVKVKPEGLGRALYDFVAQTSIELTVRKGDTITLLRRVDVNWFEGIFNNKKGIIPISYVQVLQEPIDRNMNSPSQKSSAVSPSNLENKEKLSKPNSISPSTYSPSSVSPLPVNLERRNLLSKKGGSNLIEPVMYRALYSYSPQNSDELELQEGDNVYVVEMCDDGWYVGTSVRSGVFGIFPGNYVEKAC